MYEPKLNDRVRFDDHEGWVYCITDEYFTLEIATKPKEDDLVTMAHRAAVYGHVELMKWLIGEEGGWTTGGFVIDEGVMAMAASSGNLELVQWLRGEGCSWNWWTCYWAVHSGRVEVLRWARENCCEWDAETRDKAAAELGYTDNFGNLLEEESDDEYGYDDDYADE